MAMQSASAIERQTMRKVYLRLLPFCFVLYFICYLDRVNIGFAALTMNKDLGLSSYIFGLGAGAFFWGYFILEVPSNGDPKAAKLDLRGVFCIPKDIICN